MKKPVPVPQEMPFELQELFYSRTDARGIIGAYNEVFHRVSGYSREELLGAPHNLIRHPDMPRAVFQLFWSTLQAGQPIVAYVKNMSADGRYYWVLASASPSESGYLSIRLKPTSPLFARIPALYAEVAKHEAARGMDAAREFLLEKLRELGFAQYADFGREALIQELQAREKAIAQLPPAAVNPTYRQLRQTGARGIQEYAELFASIVKITRASGEVREASAFMRDAYRGISHLAVNMAVESERAGENGRSLSVISGTFGKWVQEVHAALGAFVQSTDAISRALGAASFRMAASRLEVELLASVTEELSARTPDRESWIELRGFLRGALSALSIARDESSPLIGDVQRLRAEVARLKEAVSALYIIRQSGRVEVARLSQTSGHGSGSFETHLQEMARFVGLVSDGIARIEVASGGIQSELRSMLLRLNGMADSFRSLENDIARAA